KPEPQLRLISLCGEPMAVPAMSRCAHGVLSTKRCNSCAAVMAPPWRPPVFFMSANFESIILSYSGPSGIRHTRSPISLPTLSGQTGLPPSRLPFLLPDFAEPFGEPVVIGEQTSVFLPQRDNDRAGQSGEIDHELRLEMLVHVMEQVGEHEPALGVGVDDLDG